MNELNPQNRHQAADEEGAARRSASWQRSGRHQRADVQDQVAVDVDGQRDVTVAPDVARGQEFTGRIAASASLGDLRQPAQINFSASWRSTQGGFSDDVRRNAARSARENAIEAFVQPPVQPRPHPPQDVQPRRHPPQDGEASSQAQPTSVVVDIHSVPKDRPTSVVQPEAQPSAADLLQPQPASATDNVQSQLTFDILQPQDQPPVDLLPQAEPRGQVQSQPAAVDVQHQAQPGPSLTFSEVFFSASESSLAAASDDVVLVQPPQAPSDALQAQAQPPSDGVDVVEPQAASVDVDSDVESARDDVDVDVDVVGDPDQSITATAEASEQPPQPVADVQPQPAQVVDDVEPEAQPVSRQLQATAADHVQPPQAEPRRAQAVADVQPQPAPPVADIQPQPAPVADVQPQPAQVVAGSHQLQRPAADRVQLAGPPVQPRPGASRDDPVQPRPGASRDDPVQPRPGASRDDPDYVPSAPKRSRKAKSKKYRKRKSPYVESDTEGSSADEQASFPTRFSPRNKRGYRF